MGLQFNARTITAEKMKSCTIEKIADDIKIHAPDLLNLVGRLLDADPIIHDRRKKDRAKRERERKSQEGRKRAQKTDTLDEDDDELAILNIVNEDEDEPENIEDQLEMQRQAIFHVVNINLHH
jgi:hypothetical protein